MYAKLEVDHMGHEVDMGLIKLTTKMNKIETL